VSPIGIVSVKFAHAIARVLIGMEIWTGGGATFGAGVTAPFVASPPAVGSRASTLLICGGRDRNGRGHLKHPTGHPRPTLWPQLTCGCQLLLFHAWKGEGEQETWPRKDRGPEKHRVEDVVLASP
jgi:hypothetical protein